MDRRTQVVYYRDRNGHQPVKAFIDDLARTNPRAAAKLDHYVEHHLNDKPASAPPPSFPISSHVQGGVRELRVRFANTRFRVLYQSFGERTVLLHALEKKTQRLPAADRELAIRRAQEVRRGRGESPAGDMARTGPRPRTR